MHEVIYFYKKSDAIDYHFVALPLPDGPKNWGAFTTFVYKLLGSPRKIRQKQNYRGRILALITKIRKVCNKKRKP